jgi:phage regulator Rha-like protein
MYNLALINKNGLFYADRRQVAEMVERQRLEVLKSIRQYCDYLAEEKIHLDNFFIEVIFFNEGTAI